MPKFRFSVHRKSKMAMKFDKKAIRNAEIYKNKPKKQANFNQNKQPASLQQIHKKQAQICGKSARLATLIFYATPSVPL